MRLAVLTSQYPTVSTTFIRREIAALRRHGLEVDVFSIRRSVVRGRASGEGLSEEAHTWYVLPIGPARLLAAVLGALLRRPGAWLHALGRALGHRTGGLRGFVWSLFYFVEAIVLARELERRGVEHLHSHFADGAATAGMLAAGFLGIGWSLTLHGAADFGPVWSPLLPGKLRAARFAVCVSHFGRAQALRALPPEQWEKVCVSRCGVEMDRLPERTRGVDAEPAAVVCVARLSPEKGISGLLDAWAGLPENLRSGAQLRLIGDGPERERIAARIETAGLAGSVEMLGSLSEEDTLREVAGSQALVLASLMEGLPVALIEAMALGVPVVAPHLAGIPELVTPGVDGLLFPPADWNTLSERLAELIGDPAARRRLGAAAEARVRAEFAVDRAVEPLVRKLSAQGREVRGAHPLVAAVRP